MNPADEKIRINVEYEMKTDKEKGLSRILWLVLRGRQATYQYSCDPPLFRGTQETAKPVGEGEWIERQPGKIIKSAKSPIEKTG